MLTLSLALLFGSITYCHACSCLLGHPQEHYCQSDFVILARVKKEQLFPKTYSKVYKVRVRKEFKISEKGIVALKSGRLHTALYDSLCGVDLKVGKLYVISGIISSLRAHITRCEMILEWKDITKRQKKGLKLLYKHGCTCGIHNCMFYQKCYRQRDSCNWKSSCETTDGICLRQASGTCMWNKNKMLSKCKLQHRKNTTQDIYERRNTEVPVALIP